MCHICDVVAHGDGVSQVAVDSMSFSPAIRCLVSVGEGQTSTKLWTVDELGWASIWLLSFVLRIDSDPRHAPPSLGCNHSTSPRRPQSPPNRILKWATRRIGFNPRQAQGAQWVCSILRQTARIWANYYREVAFFKICVLRGRR